MSKFFNTSLNSRRALYMFFVVVFFLVLSLTVVYAALNVTLNIIGTAEVTAASWNVVFDNVKINSGSVEATTAPKIVDSKTINFVVGLKEPGDYYKFTVDVVNNGTIDAMIDSVVKTPELTEEQSKYLKYEIEYTDGNSISNKQLLQKNTSKTISVLVAYRSDVLPTDIPTEGESLNLSFTLIYTQSDETGVEIQEGSPLVKMVNGNYDTVGSEVAIGNEHFYIISSDESSVTMLAKYNLLVGNKYDDTNGVVALENPTGKQDSSAVGWFEGYSVENPRIGTVAYSLTNYWSAVVNNYPAYIFDLNSKFYTSIENYKVYLQELGASIEDVRLIKQEELVELGCSTSSSSCSSSTYKWVYSTTYWTGSAADSDNVYIVFTNGGFRGENYSNVSGFGVRPVVKISKIYF